MIKKELLLLPSLGATEEMLRLALEEKVIRENTWSGWKEYVRKKYHWFLRAAQVGETLKIAQFSNESLRTEIHEPEYEIFLSRKEQRYITYERSTGKWHKAMIRNLPYKWGHYENEEWASEEDREIITEYLGNDKCNGLRTAIQKWQENARHKREKEEIDAVMGQVPPYPEDFDQWIQDSAFYGCQYLFYRWKGTKGSAYCTACKETVKLRDKPVHNRDMHCPSCGRDVMAKAWGKQRYLEDTKYVGLLQTMPDGFVLRKLRCEISRKLEDNWRAGGGVWEWNRLTLDQKLRNRKEYTYGNFKRTNEMRWCNDVSGNRTDRCALVFYAGNLEQLRKQTELRYIPIEQMLQAEPGKCIELQQIREAGDIDELLIKGGYYKLAMEHISGRSRGINKNGKTMQQVLGIDKDRANRLRQMNGGSRTLEWLKEEQRTGKRIRQEVLDYLEENGLTYHTLKPMLQTGLTPERIANYIKKQQMPVHKVIEFWVDYLDMAREQGINLDDDIVRLPKKLKERHDQLVEIRNAKRLEEMLKSKQRTYKELDTKIRKHLPMAKIYFYEDETYMIIPAGKCEELVKEGQELHHCVGASTNYMKKMADGKSWILFMRKKEELEKAYYTIEISMDDDRILQWYGTYDRQPDKEIISKVLDKFRRNLKRKRKQERIQVPAAAIA